MFIKYKEIAFETLIAFVPSFLDFIYRIGTVLIKESGDLHIKQFFYQSFDGSLWFECRDFSVIMYFTRQCIFQQHSTGNFRQYPWKSSKF